MVMLLLATRHAPTFSTTDHQRFLMEQKPLTVDLSAFENVLVTCTTSIATDQHSFRPPAHGDMGEMGEIIMGEMGNRRLMRSAHSF